MREPDPPATRHDIEHWWMDLAHGRIEAGEVNAWALRHLEYNDDVEEPVIQGLLYLQSTRPSADLAPERLSHLDALAQWREERARFDEDPDKYERNRLQRMLIHFSHRQGPAKAEVFGRKMIRQGVLTEADVADARAHFAVDRPEQIDRQPARPATVDDR